MNIDPNRSVIAARYVSGLLAAAEARGLSGAALMESARIRLADLSGRGAKVSTLQFSRLYGNIVVGLRDESCGLHSRAVPPGGIEMLCRAALTTASLRDCLPVMARCIPFVMGDIRAEFQAPTTAQQARLNLFEKIPSEGDRTLAYELAIFTLCGVLSWLFGQRVPLTSVSLPFGKPRHGSALNELLAAPLHFDAETASLEFAHSAMSLPISRTPDEIPRLMRRAPASFVEVLVEQTELPARLIALVRQSMPHSLTLEEAAVRLAMSPRTIHRKLAALGENFQGIKDGWRFRHAIQLLTTTDIPIKRIAADLGFSDQATFRRAFSQWAGHPPGTLRRTRRDSAQSSRG